MKKFPMIVLIAVLPVATLAGTFKDGNDFEQVPIAAVAGVGLRASPELAKCTGRKCAGWGDMIRKGRGREGALRLSENRGGQTNSGSSGSKKGPRR